MFLFLQIFADLGLGEGINGVCAPPPPTPFPILSWIYLAYKYNDIKYELNENK